MFSVTFTGKTIQLFSCGSPRAIAIASGRVLINAPGGWAEEGAC